MERVRKKYKDVRDALETLNESLSLINDPKYQEIYTIILNGTLHSFEYSFDKFRKFLKKYLQEHKLLDISAANTRTLIREAFNANVIDEENYKNLLECLKDRNFTSHAYKKFLAEKILNRMTNHYKTMMKIMDKLGKTIGSL